MSTKVVVRHFHEGNDADRAIRDKTVYATVASIIDLDTGSVVLSNGHPCSVWASCSPKDVPSRRQGRAIAVGRLQKQFPEECASANFGPLEYLRVK